MNTVEHMILHNSKKPKPFRLVVRITIICFAATLVMPSDPSAVAAEAGKTPGQAEVLNNAAIIELHKIGLGEDVIIAKIKAANCEFDLGLDGLKSLRAAVVPDTVIKAMIEKKSGPVVVAPPSSAADQRATTSVRAGTNIHGAAKNGDLEGIKALLKDNPNLVFSKGTNGATPLHYAAANGHKEVVEVLLTNHAEVNAKDNGGSTPLHAAGIQRPQGSRGSAVNQPCRRRCQRGKVRPNAIILGSA